MVHRPWCKIVLKNENLKYIPNPLKGNNTANNGGNNVGNNNAGNTAGGATGGNNAGAANPPARVKYFCDLSFNKSLILLNNFDTNFR